MSPLPPDAGSETPTVSSDEEAAGDIKVHAHCSFLTHVSTNSVPVSPLKTDPPFLALNAQTSFL
jgi:hypothetical protein